jgi:uncharacterized membrane protein required for colicin V production
MSAILDIVLILIVVVFAVAGAKKGFFQAVSGFFSYLIGLVSSVILYKPFTAYVKKIPFLAKMMTEVEMPRLEEGIGMMEKFRAIMDYVAVNEDVGEKSEAILNNFIADVIATFISFILIFTVVSLTVKFVFWLLGLVSKIPVLKQINGILGVLIGVFRGMFWSWIFSIVFGGILFPLLNANWPGVFMSSMLESFVFKMFSEFSPIAFIADMLHKLL